jgi:hypothetical protein
VVQKAVLLGDSLAMNDLGYIYDVGGGLLTAALKDDCARRPRSEDGGRQRKPREIGAEGCFAQLPLRGSSLRGMGTHCSTALARAWTLAGLAASAWVLPR